MLKQVEGSKINSDTEKDTHAEPPEEQRSEAPKPRLRTGSKKCSDAFKANWILKSLTGTESEKIKAEFEMGWMLAKVYEDKIPIGKNITSEEKVRIIGEKLISCLRNKERRFRIHCDQSGSVNALAIPGGFTYVSEDLVELCRGDDDALAFVLAHEMAHCINGYANKRFLSKTVISALSKVHLRRGSSNPALQHLLAHLIQQGYSREQEYAADRFSVVLMKAAGYAPEGGCRLFEKLKKEAPGTDFPGAYFSSHPPLSKRI